MVKSGNLREDHIKDVIKFLEGRPLDGKILENYNYLVVCIAGHGND